MKNYYSPNDVEFISDSDSKSIIGGALKDSRISDVYAGGSSMSAISTFAIHRWLEQKKLYAWAELLWKTSFLIIFTITVLPVIATRNG